jgi:long-chain fatty acid transport protein
VVAGTISAIALAAADAAGQRFYLRSGQGAEGVALQFAGGASGGIGIASIGWNPATITMFPGRHSNINAALVYPTGSYNLQRSSLPAALQTPVGELGGDIALVPSSNSAWQITDRLWLGYTSGAPWGLRSKAENFNNAAQVYGRSSKVKSYNVAPTVGYKVTDWLSVGAALQLQYFKVELKQAFGVPAAAAVLPDAPNSMIRADDFEAGYKFGAAVTPWAGGSIGLSYRSAMHHDLHGDLKLPAPAPPALVLGKNPIEAKVHLPESVLFGVSQVLTPQWQVHAGVEWTNWSRLGRVPIFGAHHRRAGGVAQLRVRRRLVLSRPAPNTPSART